MKIYLGGGAARNELPYYDHIERERVVVSATVVSLTAQSSRQVNINIDLF